MKVYILVKDTTTCFSNGTELHFNDQFIHICTDLDTAKRSIDCQMEHDTVFRAKSGSNGGFYDSFVYARKYVDRYNSGNSVIFRVIEKEIDDIPEVEENDKLKKSVKDLEKQVVDLKARLNSLTGSKATFKTESSENKEEKSYVNRW